MEKENQGLCTYAAVRVTCVALGNVSKFTKRQLRRPPTRKLPQFLAMPE